MRQVREIYEDIQVVIRCQDLMCVPRIVNDASCGWRRAPRHRGRSRRRTGYVQPIAAEAVLGQLHAAPIPSHP